ncbi:3-deoxy-D-manno-octulosonic acid transferase [Mangrovimonas sp. YM274]|uniref:3-deoxy-D-manno-octulosonic acid transferase n=1 Tax=Mangrovimonas sp. YM274 TaxID=3070660 RepID=UPI0027DE2E35|nr:glycosyltransferase N-terminal domain-containing protein [Mangrovimonas sp. YM274]WMI69493.1 glycosyltransferase N-terminal domain-containing protein [Mangrovimonas sp. YM274]
MNLLYNLGIFLTGIVLKIIALFNPKIKLGVEGRANTFKILKQSILPEDKTLWFHCASLGEYEQGLPVFKKLRVLYPNHKVVLSFFSPSGYEIRKNSEIADSVVYLPLDSKSKAKKFVDLVHPEITVFVKYDIWPNVLNELEKRHLKAFLISANFRPQQSYFKFYGEFMRQALKSFDHIFVQNESSKVLLDSIGITQTSVTGDTRFDRVSDQLNQDNNLPFINEFKQDALCVVIGSSWPEDEALLIPHINAHASENVKYIIAPHNIKPNLIADLKAQITAKTVLFSEKEDKNLSDYSVLIVDTIGLLTKIYAYADIAYVGGAMGKTGLHNILEPSVFGVPVIIGKNYQKFPEAHNMIAHGGVQSISSHSQLDSTLTQLIENENQRKQLGFLNTEFVKKNKDAVIQIINYIRK